MAGTLRLAWRNLGRNRRRTVITGLAMAVGISLSVASYGLTDGTLVELLDGLTGFDLGHVQIHHPDFPRRRRMRDTITGYREVIATVRGESGVRAAGPRLYGYALVSTDKRSEGAELVGVDPAVEPAITTLARQVRQGRYLDPEPTPWPRGRELTAEEKARDRQLTAVAEEQAIAEIDALEGAAAAEPGGAAAPTADSRSLALVQSPPPERPPRVVVGAGLAKVLGVGVGDHLHAIGYAVDGTAEEVELEIVGVFRTGTSLLDRGRIYTHIADLQRFTHLYDQAHEIAVVSGSPADAGALAGRLRADLAGSGVLVQSWAELRPDIRQMIDVSRLTTALMIFIILFVATLGVVNTMLMAVFERTRELGVLKAIGMTGFRVVRLVVAETLLLVVASSVVGTGIGLLMDLYMVNHGVHLNFSDSVQIGGIGIDPVLHGAITATGVIAPTVILAVTCLVASLYPAIRAARLAPAVGMRET